MMPKPRSRSRPPEQLDELYRLCMDCGQDTEASGKYMLEDRLWRQINPFIIGVMCLPCVENRLGRPLYPSDFLMPKAVESALEWPALAERLKRSQPETGSALTADTDRFKDELSARLAKKRPTQGRLGRLSAEILLTGGASDLGEIPEFVALLSRSGMLGSHDPLETILVMAEAGLQSRAAEQMQSLRKTMRELEK
jgi:hypothetical protein